MKIVIELDDVTLRKMRKMLASETLRTKLDVLVAEYMHTRAPEVAVAAGFTRLTREEYEAGKQKAKRAKKRKPNGKRANA